MRAAIRLLTLLCLLWCGLHVAEPAAANEVRGAAVAAVDAAPPADPCDGGGSGTQGGHHHCPVAPDQYAPAAETAPITVRTLLLATPATALASLTHAPPLQPPAA